MMRDVRKQSFPSVPRARHWLSFAAALIIAGSAINPVEAAGRRSAVRRGVIPPAPHVSAPEIKKPRANYAGLKESTHGNYHILSARKRAESSSLYRLWRATE